jgi:hypothetical protein
MRKTRAQFLWTFQIYLDLLNIMEPERRLRLSTMFLERKLSKATEVEFGIWLRTNHLTQRRPVLLTRVSRLAFFAAWLNRFRPTADTGERERLTRLYYTHALDRKIEVEFHRYISAEILGAGK